jgi:hypothetical protein
MRQALVSIFLWLTIFPASAQFFPGVGADKIQVTPNIAPVKTILKISLLAPIEEKRSVRLAAEVTITKNLSIQPEFGFIYDYGQGSLFRLEKGMINFSQRLAMRYYIPQKIFNGFYFGPMIDFESINYQKASWRIPNMANPDSAQLDFSNPALFHENSYGLYLLAGIQPQLSRHFTLDLSGGIGFLGRHVITQFDPKLTNGAALPPPQELYSFTGLLSLNLGYVF